MEKWDRVAIVGLGLIGGSLALALRKAGVAGRVVGCGRKAERLQYALDNEIVDDVTKDPVEAVAGADLVVTTQKDHVKLPRLAGDASILQLVVEIKLVEGEAELAGKILGAIDCFKCDG